MFELRKRSTIGLLSVSGPPCTPLFVVFSFVHCHVCPSKVNFTPDRGYIGADSSSYDGNLLHIVRWNEAFVLAHKNVSTIINPLA